MPDIKNLTRFAAVDLPSVDRHGFGLLVVCVSGRFALPPPGRTTDTALQLTEAQTPPTMEDVYWGEPGSSSLKYEGQSCYVRPGTDITMNGNAWARLGRPAIAVPVSLQVGTCHQRLAVIGDRYWRRGTFQGAHISRPEPFASLPLVYERAFGGTPAVDLSEPRNPVGRGLYRNLKEAMDRPLPNIESSEHLIRDLKDHPPPIGVGPIARNWQPRLSFAGTYDRDG